MRSFAVLALAFSLTAGHAATLRMAIQNDATSLDPHVGNLLPNARLLHNVYESLVMRDENFNIAPALATAWSQPTPLTWRFTLRAGVKFHDGSTLSADDVVFSVERALHPLSQLKSSVAGVVSAKKIDTMTVELQMKEPNPVLLNHLPRLAIMSRAWAEKHGALQPQRFRDNEDTYASRNANGTGPFRVVSREPDVRTRLAANPAWWNRAAPVRGNVEEIVWLPMNSNATRIAALLSGEVDFVVDPPLQDIARLKANAKVRVLPGGEARVHYLGFDLGRDNLLYGSADGKNPFKDHRVRQAVAHAIDTEAIRAKVFRGFTAPAALLVTSKVGGYAPVADHRLPFDRARAKRLLAEAGYANGFAVTLDCMNTAPNSELCQAIAAMLSAIGIRTTPNFLPIGQFIPKVQKADTSFFWYSWGAVTFDALHTLQSLVQTYGGENSGRGDTNMGRYSNAALDKLIDAARIEPDRTQRDALLGEALALVAKELPVVALHQPLVPWATRSRVSLAYTANSLPELWRARVAGK